MLHRPRSIVSFALFALFALTLTGCASTAAPRLTPLVVQDDPAYTYHATVGGPGSARDVEALVDLAGGDTSEKEGVPVVDVLVDLLSMSRDEVERLIGWQHGARVWTTSLEGAQLVIAAAKREQAVRIQTPRLALYLGQRGRVTVINQVAYVSHFEVKVVGPEMIADPTVEVAQDGVFLETRATLGERRGTLDLELVLRLADLQRPFPEQRVRIPGSAVPATIQTPITAVQEVRTRATVAPNQCLILIANVADDPDAVLVTLVHAQLVAPEDL